MGEIDLRRLLKRFAFIFSLALTSPLILMAWIEKACSNSESIFVALSQLLSLIPGKIGSYLRSAYYFGTIEKCSWEVHIGFGTFFSHRSAILGSNVAIGAYCIIGTVEIANEVMMASHVSVTSGKRQHFDDEGKISSNVRLDRVTIGKKTWIGEGAIVLSDVGSNCVVSAGTVVANNIPNSRLVAGNPGKIIRELEK